MALYLGSALRYVRGNDLQFLDARPVQSYPGALGKGWFKGVVEPRGGFMRYVGKRRIWVWVPVEHQDNGECGGGGTRHQLPAFVLRSCSGGLTAERVQGWGVGGGFQRHACLLPPLFLFFG